MKTFALLILLAVSASAQNVTNLYIGQQFYIGQALSSVPSAGGGGSTNAVLLYDSFDSGTSGWTFGNNADTYYAGQETFLSLSNLTVTKIQTKIKVNSDSSGRTAYIRLWSTNGTALGNNIATSDGIPVTNSWDGTQVLDFNFTSSAKLTNSVFYHWTLEFYPTNAVGGNADVRVVSANLIPGQLSLFKLDKTDVYPGTFGGFDVQFRIWGTSQ